MTSPNQPHATRHTRPRGFTFAEVMFAVMILGIGFIMVAAMFPVAIRQTQSTVEEISGTAEAQRGAAILRRLGPAIAGTANPAAAAAPGGPYANVIVELPLPAAGGVPSSKLYSFFTRPAHVPLGTTIPFDVIKGNVINKLDPRYAWIPVAYQTPLQQMNSATNAPVQYDANGNIVPSGGTIQIPDTAKVWVVAVQKRDPDNPTYTEAPTNLKNDRDAGVMETHSTPLTPPVRDGVFKPKLVHFKLVEGEDPASGNVYPDTIVFTDISGATPTDEPAAAENCYVWVADDQVVGTIPSTPGPNGMYLYQPGDAHGRFYRLGPQVLDTTGQPLPGVWEILPGVGMGISRDPGPDGLTNTADDGPSKLENLPPRPYDGNPGPHPYASGTYSNITGAGGNTKPAVGFMIGRALKDPTLPYNVTTNPYVGTAQDLIALPPVSIDLQAK